MVLYMHIVKRNIGGSETYLICERIEVFENLSKYILFYVLCVGKPAWQYYIHTSFTPQRHKCIIHSSQTSHSARKSKHFEWTVNASAPESAVNMKRVLQWRKKQNGNSWKEWDTTLHLHILNCFNFLRFA